MKIYKLLILFSLALLLLGNTAHAQIVTEEEPQPKERPSRDYEDKAWKWNNFYFGGFPVFGIGGGNAGLSISAGISAEAGYFVHERVSVGVRTSYIFSNYRYGNNSSQKLHLIAGSPYLRGYIWKGLYGQAEYQISNLLGSINDPTFNADFTLRNNSLLLGGGFHDGFENGFGYYIGIMFSVLNSGTNFTTNPEFRLGFTYRLPNKE